MTGDTVLCADCGGWFQVLWKMGGAVELRRVYAVGLPIVGTETPAMEEVGRVGGVRFFKLRGWRA